MSETGDVNNERTRPSGALSLRMAQIANEADCMQSPGLTRVVMDVAPPGELHQGKDRGYVLLHTHTPVDMRRHIWRVLVNCKADHVSPGDPNISAAHRVASMFPSVIEENQ